MTELEIQIQMAKAYAKACLRSALDHQLKDKGGFSIEQDKAWLAYDDANERLARLYQQNLDRLSRKSES